MLQTKYFEHWNPKGRFEASSDQYTLPAELVQHVDFVKPGVISSDVTGRTRRSREHIDLGSSCLMALVQFCEYELRTDTSQFVDGKFRILQHRLLHQLATLLETARSFRFSFHQIA